MARLEDFKIPDSGVKPGVYGSTTKIPKITLGRNGQILQIEDLPIIKVNSPNEIIRT